MMTPSDLLKTELEEFEALLDDGEPSDPMQIQRHNENHRSSLQPHYNNSTPNKTPRMILNPMEGLMTEMNSARSKIKDFEQRGPSLTHILPPLSDIKRDIGKKKCLTEFHKLDKEKPLKRTIPNIVLTQPNDEKTENRTTSRLALPSENLKEVNKQQQKASYNELMTLFKDSTSNNPTRVFDEHIPTPFIPTSSRRSSIELRESAVKAENALAVPQLETKASKKDFVLDPILALKQEEAIKSAKKTIEDLVAAIQCETSENYTQSHKYESQKIDMNNWRELSQYRKPLESIDCLKKIVQPSKVEIVIIDMVKFGIQDRTELVLSAGYYQDIGNTVNMMVKEISGTQNEGKHILTRTKEIILQQIFFIVKNNNKYPIGLKNEKEIIMNYLITLGIFQFKLKFEDKPVSEEKINFVKNKALNLTKGMDTSISPFLCDWLNLRVRQKIFVEKYYINQNIKGKTDVNFMYNFLDYLSSISSRFLLPPEKTSAREKPAFGMGSSTMFGKSWMTDSSIFKRSNRSSAKHLTGLSNDPLYFADNIIPSSTASKKPKVSQSPLLFENNSDTLHTQRQTPRKNSFIPQLNISNSPHQFGKTSSLMYLTPRERNHTLNTPKEVKAAKKFYEVAENVDFVDLNIRKPKSSYQNLNSYFRNIITSESIRAEKGKNSQYGYLGFV